MKFVTAAACFFFLLFVSARAVRVPFTYDEAASDIRYIDTSVASVFDTNALSIFNFEVATNHFLNTALTRLSYLVAGGSELALRLPNLLGYALYLGFALLILRRLSDPVIAVGGLLLLNLNPYLLDFFGLSRGYGLSLGLMMGALFYLLRYLDHSTPNRVDAPLLARALAFACAAVMANFAMLNVYLSIIAVVAIAAALVNRRASGAAIQYAGDASERLQGFPWLLLAAAAFVPLVLSQDIALSRSLYEPVAVRLIGPGDEALDRARVVRLDIHGRESLLPRDAGSAAWSSNSGSHFRGLRIELPRDETERLKRIEAVIGSRAFTLDPRLTGAWTTRDVGEMRLFESAPALSLPRSHVPTFRSVMNWAGDRIYAVQLMIASAYAWAILTVGWLLLRHVGRIVVRANVVRPRECRVLSSSLLWVAILAGPPLYLLKRNSELYFGGTHGLVDDTFTSVISNSFYGRIYSGSQVPFVFACIAGTIAIFLVVLAIANRRGHLSTLTPATSLLAILLITSCSLVVQRLSFGTVYLVGRTALFYIPLFVLFFSIVCDRLAQAGRAGRGLSLSIVSAAVMLATLHFARTANLKYVHDWKDDASTKFMIDDVRQFVAGEPVTVGVAPPYAPVAVYYARRAAPSPIDVVVVPTTRAIDFLYVEDHNPHSSDIVSRYPLTRMALERMRR